MSYLIYILKLKMSYLICRIPGWGGWGWNEGRRGGKLPRFRTTQHTLNISNQSFLPIHVYPTPSLSSFVTHDYRNVGFICILFIHTNTFFKLANRKKNQQLRARLIKLFCYIIPNSESMISTHADWETVVFQVQFYCVLKTMSFKSLKRFNINVVKYLEQKFDFLDNVY